LKMMITGSSGQLGSEIVRVLSSSHELFPLTRGDLDVTNTKKVMEVVTAVEPDVIIHTAAFTNVDKAEKESERAFDVNAQGTRNLAEAAQQVNAKLVYISTDYVFSGQKGELYTELDPPSPLGVYGSSKLLGEQFVEGLCTKFFILRTAWLFGSHGKNFVKTMYSLARTKNKISAAVDCIGSPTYALDLALFIGHLVSTDKYGIYHAANQGSCSRYEFVQAIVEEAGLNRVDIIPVESSVFSLPAARPLNSALDNRAIRQNGLPLFRDWRSALHAFMAADHYFRETRNQ
jgi:dTDP-4-dehydrorhamnose reductase